MHEPTNVLECVYNVKCLDLVLLARAELHAEVS